MCFLGMITSVPWVTVKVNHPPREAPTLWERRAHAGLSISAVFNAVLRSIRTYQGRHYYHGAYLAEKPIGQVFIYWSKIGSKGVGEKDFGNCSGYKIFFKFH